MRIILLIKILLAICCIYFSIRIIYINGQIDNSISEKYTAFNKLRGDPSLDTAGNRKRHLQKKVEFKREIDSLSEKRYPTWCRYIGLILGIIASLLAQDIYNTLFKKKRLN